MTGIKKADIYNVLKSSIQDRSQNNGFKLDKFRYKKEIGTHWFGNKVVDERSGLSD